VSEVELVTADNTRTKLVWYTELGRVHNGLITLPRVPVLISFIRLYKQQAIRLGRFICIHVVCNGLFRKIGELPKTPHTHYTYRL